MKQQAKAEEIDSEEKKQANAVVKEARKKRRGCRERQEKDSRRKEKGREQKTDE